MDLKGSTLRSDERAQLELRSLYSSYGYRRYKMSKFEEYDLYARNKDFLVSDRVITFTDTNGKLMALKPDVTLSIIRNCGDVEGCVTKLYYNENVYRVSKGNGVFGEIMQTGLECIGDVDAYSIFEVIMLAAESLGKISADYVLDISHMGVVEYAIERAGLPADSREKTLAYIGEKNAHELRTLCAECGADASPLETLVSTWGRADSVIPTLKEVFADCDALCELEELVHSLGKCGYGEHINIDFSVTGNARYYNGFVFNGFVNGISSRILSGGQYDKLMQSMGRRSRAVGFAIYLDLLERFGDCTCAYDVDTVILYDDGTPLDVLLGMIKMLNSSGKSVTAQRKLPEGLHCKQLMRLREGSVEIIENNA